jgi:hypothetical protein
VIELLVILVVLETPAIVALLDCKNREPHQFARGAEERRAWLLWLVVGVATAWLLIGNGIVLAYYYAVIRRNTPH